MGMNKILDIKVRKKSTSNQWWVNRSVSWTEFFFGPVFLPRIVSVPDLRRFPRILWEVVAMFSSSPHSAGTEVIWPSPSSFHRSCIGSCWDGFSVDVACSLVESRLELWRDASCSSFNRRWTISLGLVTSVKFLLPTTISWTCEQISFCQLENLWLDWHLFDTCQLHDTLVNSTFRDKAVKSNLTSLS